MYDGRDCVPQVGVIGRRLRRRFKPIGLQIRVVGPFRFVPPSR